MASESNLLCYTPLCRAQDFLSSTFMASVIHIMVPLNSYFCLVLSYVQTWISNYLFDNNTYRSQQAQSTWVKQILGALILSPAFPLHPQCHGSRPSTRSRVQTIVRSCSLHLTYLSPACSSSPSVPRTAFSSRRLPSPAWASPAVPRSHSHICLSSSALHMAAGCTVSFSQIFETLI